MKAVFLGTSGSIPTKKAGLPSVAVHAHEWMLFDCGEGTQRQMMQFGVPYGSINAIFISHLHLDHYLGLYGYMETLRMSGRVERLNLYVPEGFDRRNLPEFVDIHYIREGRLYENKEFEVYAFRVDHGILAYGFKVCRKRRRKFDVKKSELAGLKGTMFGKILEEGHISVNGRDVNLDDVSSDVYGPCLVYSGDTRPSENLIRNSSGVDVLIHEAMLLSDKEELAVERKHSTALEAGAVGRAARVGRLILTHISPRYEDRRVLEEEAKREFENTVCAYDGMRIDW